MSPKKTDEEYGETLVRLDIDIENFADIATFKKYLSDELGITNPDFQEALWAETPRYLDYEKYDIHGVTITYPWGREVRYGVQGLPGLWGWESIIEIMASEER